MAVARTQTFDQRAAILDRLLWRNRVVAILRVAVPALGVAVFVALVLQIWLANVAHQYGVSGLRIDRGNLVVETPQYAGIGPDGSRYVVNASEARTPFANTSRIDMTLPTFDFIRPGRPTFHVAGATATMDTDRQYVDVPGVSKLNSDDGLHGTLHELSADLKANTTVADGPVDVTFADGTTLSAANMHFDGNANYWVFEQATLVMPDLPRAPVPTIPFFTSPWVVQ